MLIYICKAFLLLHVTKAIFHVRRSYCIFFCLASYNPFFGPSVPDARGAVCSCSFPVSPPPPSCRPSLPVLLRSRREPIASAPDRQLLNVSDIFPARGRLHTIPRAKNRRCQFEADTGILRLGKNWCYRPSLAPDLQGWRRRRRESLRERPRKFPGGRRLDGNRASPQEASTGQKIQLGTCRDRQCSAPVRSGRRDRLAQHCPLHKHVGTVGQWRRSVVRRAGQGRRERSAPPPALPPPLSAREPGAERLSGLCVAGMPLPTAGLSLIHPFPLCVNVPADFETFRLIF